MENLRPHFEDFEDFEDFGPQIKLIFKLFYELERYDDAIKLIFKLQSTHPIFLAINTFWMSNISRTPASLKQEMQLNYLNCFKHIVAKETNDYILACALNMLGHFYSNGIYVRKKYASGIGLL